MTDDLYAMFLDADEKLRETILGEMWDAYQDGDKKRVKAIHSRLAKLAADVTNPDWLKPKAKEAK